MNIKPDLEDVIGLLGRLSAVYGQPKDRSPKLAEIMATEWERALGHLPLAAVAEAIEKHIRSSKFWPVPAEIIDLAKDAAKDLREQLQWARDDLRPPRSLQIAGDKADDHPPFKPTEAEIISVKSTLERWKAEREVITDRMDQWAPASKGGASDTLKALVAKQRGTQ